MVLSEANLAISKLDMPFLHGENGSLCTQRDMREQLFISGIMLELRIIPLSNSVIITEHFKDHTLSIHPFNINGIMCQYSGRHCQHLPGFQRDLDTKLGKAYVHHAFTDTVKESQAGGMIPKITV